MSTRLMALALVVALFSACSGGGTDEPAIVTAGQLPSLVPSAEEVAMSIGVPAVHGRESDGLTQAFEGIDLPDGLESYGYGYTAGDPNAVADWWAVGVSLVLAPSDEEAIRLVEALTAGAGWSAVEIDPSSTAVTQHLGPGDGFTGDRVMARSGALLLDVNAIGSADVDRAETARALAAAILERAAEASE